MSRGKRYDDAQKLNMKKVLAIVLIIAAIVLFIFGINKLLHIEKNNENYFSEITYYSMYQNEKWGVINSKGETVIEPEYGEMIVIPDNKKAVFVCTYDVNYSDGTYKTKAINASNSQIFEGYATIEALSNYDSNGNIWNEDNVLKVSKDGKFGLINLDGNEVLSCSYEKIDTIRGVKNSIIIQKDGLCGLANSQGNVIIECIYPEITALTSDYTNGYVVKNAESKYGLISINKEQVLECKYTEIKHICGNDMYIVKEDNKWKIVNSAGDKSLEIDFEDVNYMNSDVIVAKNGGKYGIWGTDKSEKVKAEYDSIEHAFSDSYIASKEGKYGVITSSANEVVPFEYTNLAFNKEADCLYAKKADDNNMYLIDRSHEVKVSATEVQVFNGFIRAKVNDEYKYYNLKFEEKSNRDAFDKHTLYVAKNDGKYGLVNKDGTLVVQYMYEDATEQNDFGFVAVKKDGKWGVIDQYGNTVVEPKYEFKDATKVAFIGKWHSVENVHPIYFITE